MSNEKVKKSGFFSLVKIAFRNIFRNKRRTVLCLTAIALAVFIIILLMSYIKGLTGGMEKVAQTFESGHIKIVTKEFDTRSDYYPLQYYIDDIDSYIREIESIPGVKKASPRILSYATLSSSKVKHGLLGGVNFDDIRKSAGETVKYAYYNYIRKNNGLIAGRFPDQNTRECLIGLRMAMKMEIIPAVMEKNEFEWFSANIEDEKNKIFLNECYAYNDAKKLYTSTFLYQKDKALSSDDKQKFINLLNIFLSLNITSLPREIEENSGILYNLFYKEFQKEEFLQAYDYQSGTRIYKQKDSLDSDVKESLLSTFQAEASLRIQLKIISSQYSDKYYSPKIVGAFEYDYGSFDKNLILISYDSMQKLAALPNRAQSIFIYLDDVKDVARIKSEIQLKLNNTDFVMKDWTQFPTIMMFQQMDVLYVIVYMVFIIVASFLIINTIVMIINERIKEIGMMGAIGMVRREIVTVFFLEALFISTIGAFIGVVSGGALTAFLNNVPINYETLSQGVDFPTTSTIFIKFSFPSLIIGFLYGTIVSSCCAIIPSMKAAFITPVEALRK